MTVHLKATIVSCIVIEILSLFILSVIENVFESINVEIQLQVCDSSVLLKLCQTINRETTWMARLHGSPGFILEPSTFHPCDA